MAKSASADVERVTIDVRPDKGLATQTTALQTRAASVIVDSTEAAKSAKIFLAGVQELRRKIEQHYGDIKRPLNDARNKVLEMEKRDLEPVKAIERQITGKVADFEAAEERERRRLAQEEADRFRKEAEDRRRREEEALRQQAKLTRKRDEKAALNQMADAVAAAPPVEVAVAVQPVKADTKVSDMITRVDWSGEVVDFALHVKLVAEGKAPLESLAGVDVGWLRRQAVALQGKLGDVYPSLRSQSKTSYVSRS